MMERQQSKLLSIAQNKMVLSGLILTALSALGYVLTFAQAAEIAVHVGIVIVEILAVIGLVQKLKRKGE